jgi:hypothetical protein
MASALLADGRSHDPPCHESRACNSAPFTWTIPVHGYASRPARRIRRNLNVHVGLLFFPLRNLMAWFSHLFYAFSCLILRVVLLKKLSVLRLLPSRNARRACSMASRFLGPCGRTGFACASTGGAGLGSAMMLAAARPRSASRMPTSHLQTSNPSQSVLGDCIPGTWAWFKEPVKTDRISWFIVKLIRLSFKN